MASLVAYGMLAYLLILGIPVRWLRWVLVSLLALLVLAIGFSRMFLGAHWFSDVVAGYCAATIWLTFCITSVEALRRRRLRMVEAAGAHPAKV
jgi:undecaprenyl-diphosphatase